MAACDDGRKGPWWELFRFVFCNREVVDDGRKGVVFTRPVHAGTLGEPRVEERFEVLWCDGTARGTAYNTTRPSLLSWEQLKPIVTERFVRTQKPAPLVEHLLLPLQERNWHATQPEYDEMVARTREEARHMQASIKRESQLLDVLERPLTRQQQQQQQRATDGARQTGNSKPTERPAAAKPVAAKPVAAKPAAPKPVAAKPAAAKLAATKPAAAKPVAGHSRGSSPSSSSSSKQQQEEEEEEEPQAKESSEDDEEEEEEESEEEEEQSEEEDSKEESSDSSDGSGSSSLSGDSLCRPRYKPALERPRRSAASAPPAASPRRPRRTAAAAAPSACRTAAAGAASNQKRKRSEERGELQQQAKHRILHPACRQGDIKQLTGGAAAPASTPAKKARMNKDQQQQPPPYVGITGRNYPVSVACRPGDLRLGTAAYDEAGHDGVFEVERIVDEVELPRAAGGKRRGGGGGAAAPARLVLPKWSGYELDVRGWEEVAGMRHLELYREWAAGPKPAYFTAVAPEDAAKAALEARGRR